MRLALCRSNLRRCRTALASIVFGLSASAVSATAATIIDYSYLPINETNSGFGVGIGGNVGGVQFLNTVTFQLETVQVLLGRLDAATQNFRIFQFDGAMGDTTGTLIGSVLGVASDYPPFANFATDSALIDVSALNLVLQANVVYGFALEGAAVAGGSTGGFGDTSANVGTIFGGSLGGTFQTLPEYEIPFIATGSLVPEPSTGLLLLSGLLGLAGWRRRVRA
jgi:PEP-CTERM motif